VDKTNSPEKSSHDSAGSSQHFPRSEHDASEVQPSKSANRDRVHDDEDDPYFDRSMDMVQRIRKLRQAAEKKMNQMGDLADYDIRYIYGKKGSWAEPGKTEPLSAEQEQPADAEPQASPVPGETGSKKDAEKA
jgi:hypothetical protein